MQWQAGVFLHTLTHRHTHTSTYPEEVELGWWVEVPSGTQQAEGRVAVGNHPSLVTLAHHLPGSSAPSLRHQLALHGPACFPGLAAALSHCPEVSMPFKDPDSKRPRSKSVIKPQFHCIGKARLISDYLKFIFITNFRHDNFEAK